MPEIFRVPYRFNCAGIDLVHPVDRMPPGYYPYLANARVVEEGRIDGRPGYTGPANSTYPNYITLQTPSNIPNSIRRLNDPSMVYSIYGYIYVGGGGTELYAGIESAYIGVDGGYSGSPLSLIPFRPANSPESWMYVYDANKLSKVRPDGLVRPIGIAPPPIAPAIEYVQPAWVDVDTGQEDSGWTASGQLEDAGFGVDRTNGSGVTIGHILYNVGNTGWCCISPSMSDYQSFWMGARMKVNLQSGPENVVVREIWKAIPDTAILGIQYDTGSTGMCSIVLQAPIAALPGGVTGLSRNSLIQIESEVVRVLEVNLSPDGTNYSIRCSTVGSYTFGAIVIGLLSWYVYTVGTHSAGETISSLYIEAGTSASGTIGTLTSGTLAVNASIADGRPIDPANDYLHISLFLQNPQFVENIQLLASLDPTPNFNFINPGNTWIWTISSSQLNPSSSGDSWVEIVIPISSGVRSGNDLTLTFANITGLAIQITTQTDNPDCGLGFDWWYFFGTYGPTIQPNSPTGMVYLAAYRDSTTGAHSVPSPQNRQALFPLREGVIVSPQTTSQLAVDSIDIYRQGATVTSPLYIGTTINSFLPAFFVDSLPDTYVLETSQSPDLNAIQPWPLLQAPWSGTCKVTGVSVELLTGSLFQPTLLSATAIVINGTTYLTYGQPVSLSMLQLQEDGGNFASVPYLIPSPTLAAQPLPYAFGALEGPFAPVIFGLGDPINCGLLYFCNFSDADSCSDANTLELSGPSGALISGTIWNGMCFCGNRDTIFNLRFSYLTTIGASNNTSFQWYKIPSPSGMWSRWTCCTGPDGVYFLGRDGVYKLTEQGAVNITDEQLYPLFPHDGQVALGAEIDGISVLPVDMSQV
jgi:hypothetical protein